MKTVKQARRIRRLVISPVKTAMGCIQTTSQQCAPTELGITEAMLITTTTYDSAVQGHTQDVVTMATIPAGAQGQFHFSMSFQRSHSVHTTAHTDLTKTILCSGLGARNWRITHSLCAINASVD